MFAFPPASSLAVGVALTQHLALALPLPEIRYPDDEPEQRPKRMQNGSQFTVCFLGLCKAITWYSAATRAIRSYQGHSSHSETTWLSTTGIVVLGASAALNCASAGALGRQLHFPLVPDTIQQLLHIPVAHKLRPENIGKHHDLTLSPAHTLVMTGPYRVVRHPMYASVLLGLVGSGLFYLSSASPVHGLLNHTLELTRLPLARVGLLPILGRIGNIVAKFANCLPWEGFVGGVFSCSFAYIAMHLYRTAEMEDEALRVRFGKRWRLYQWKVPYMFFPGLF